MVPDSLALSAAKRILERYSRRVVHERRLERRHPLADAVFEIGGQRFIVGVKSSARSDSVARAVAQVRHAAEREPKGEPLLVVPSMGEVGAAICERERVHWIDLHGNASVSTDGLSIYVRGRHDAEMDLGDEAGANPFSKAASRVVHLLLIDPHKEWRRVDIEAATGLDKGYVSKIVGALSTQGYVQETVGHGARVVRVDDPIVLLDAWRERYKPSRPRFWGLVAAHNGQESLAKTIQALVDADVEYAVGGFGAAAHYTNFGSFRRVDVSINGALPDAVMAKLRVSATKQGRNVAFHDDLANASLATMAVSGVRFASPVLTYLDLSQLPERSEEAAEEMRRYLLSQWS